MKTGSIQISYWLSNATYIWDSDNEDDTLLHLIINNKHYFYFHVGDNEDDINKIIPVNNIDILNQVQYKYISWLKYKNYCPILYARKGRRRTYAQWLLENMYPNDDELYLDCVEARKIKNHIIFQKGLQTRAKKLLQSTPPAI